MLPCIRKTMFRNTQCTLPIMNDKKGQASVEAAFLLPVLLVVFGLLLQPVILLYNAAVMNAAAAEACRTAGTIEKQSSLDAFLKRRLGAIPQLSIFHDGNWSFEYKLNSEDLNCITIKHDVTTLPLLGISAGLLSKRKNSHQVEQTVHVQTQIQPPWLSKSEKSVEEWVDSWK